MNQEQIRQNAQQQSGNQASLEKNTIEQEHASTKHSYGEHAKKPQDQQQQQSADKLENHQDLLDPDHPQNNVG